jgi:hypothetical protein
MGDDQVTLAGAEGDRGAPGIALQRVRRAELFDVLADLSGDPGGETATEAGKAQVDLALVLRRGLGQPNHPNDETPCTAGGFICLGRRNFRLS